LNTDTPIAVIEAKLTTSKNNTCLPVSWNFCTTPSVPISIEMNMIGGGPVRARWVLPSFSGAEMLDIRRCGAGV